MCAAVLRPNGMRWWSAPSLPGSSRSTTRAASGLKSVNRRGFGTVEIHETVDEYDGVDTQRAGKRFRGKRPGAEHPPFVHLHQRRHGIEVHDEVVLWRNLRHWINHRCRVIPELVHIAHRVADVLVANLQHR